MSEKYFVKKNIPNNLHNSNQFMSQGKKSFRGSKNIINSASQEGAKTTEKINEAYRIDEISPKEEDIDHLHQFHLEKENRKNSLNLNKIPALSFINPFQNDNNFKRTISTRIPHPVKKEALIPIEANRVRNGIIKRRKASGERQPVKQIQSRYNSFSENKYHFMHRLSDSHKFGMYQLGNNDISKINSGPIDNFRDSNNLNNIKHLNSMKNSGEKIYTYRNSKNNTVNDIFSSSDSNSSPIEKNNYIENIVKNDKSENKNIDNRENRFLNNKNITNNSVNDFNLQNNIQLTKIEQNNNIIQNKNKLISNYNLSTQNPVIDYTPVNSNIQEYQNAQKYNNNLNNNIMENKRMTVGYKYTNEQNKNLENYYQSLIQQNQLKNAKLNFNEITKKIPNEEPQVAIVTKLSSSEDNNLGYGPISQSYNSQNILKNNQIYINSSILNTKISQPNKSQIINKSANNYLTEEEINRIFNQSTMKNQQLNSYLLSSMIPRKTSPKLPNNYRIVNNENYNISNINSFYPQNQNIQNNYILYNQGDSQRATVINSKINKISSINKPLINNNLDIFYNSNNYNGGSGLIKKYDGVSRPGKDSSGSTKTNQDAYVCKSNINNINDFNMFGVLDGHGPDGHFVSEFISEFIPSQIINHKDIINLRSSEVIYKKLKENNCKIINQAFIAADKQLRNMEFDVSESGCTCCLIIHLGNHIICANTGDSRAILVYDQANEINSKNLDYLGIVPLSIDYKPELPEEASRIILAGGEVEQMKDEYGEGSGPYRVWVRGKDYPGLAMSRSIGDLKGKTVGVIPDPGIMEYDLNKSTKFIIICSDGVWEFLNNETVMNIGKKFYLENQVKSFCQEVVSEAFNAWEKNDSIVDDITAVAVFF